MIDLGFLNSEHNCIYGILIRHSERDFIPNKANDLTTPITTLGKQKARTLGEYLRKFEKLVIYSSPILRCVQTSEEISKGFNKTSTIHTSNILGLHGPFVYDSEKAEKEFTSKGLIQVVKDMQNCIQIEGARGKEEGSKILLSFIKEAFSKANKDEFLIFISHDAIITVFLNYIFQEYFDKQNWLNFLDGCGLIKDLKRINFIRKEKSYEY